MKARATPILITLLCTLGCTSHLSIGRDYQSRNNFPLAVEYFDAGLEKDPGDEKLKDAFIIAEQTYQWRLRKQIDRLVESRSYLQAMTVLTELTERALRMLAMRRAIWPLEICAASCAITACSPPGSSTRWINP